MSIQSLDELFIHTLKDVYNAEKQILKELPQMAQKADADELKNAFSAHFQETRNQVKRLEKVFEIMKAQPKGEKCEALQGLVEEGKEVMEMEGGKSGSVLDAGLIAAAQAIEHYEIARYGTLCAWAKQLGKNDAAALLEETLKEEYSADRKLNEIAMRLVNKKAA